MQKGFLSFFIVLFFGLLFINQLNISATFNEFNASEKTLLEIEKTNFLRTELEINFDHFVKEFLSASLGGSTTVELLNSNFAQSLNNFIG
ncbi:MAG: hypothetical protein Q7K42_03955, partial [Candidatus Diapherotrites archaeon]|nr:hypothetical protein [Candidatus Diapherotrites archaeon]